MSSAANFGKPSIARIVFVGAMVAGLLFLPLFHNHPLFPSGSSTGNLTATDFCLFCALGFFVTGVFALLAAAHVLGVVAHPAQIPCSFVRIAATGTRGPPRL